MMNSYRRNDGRNVRRLLLVTVAVVVIFAIDLALGGVLRGFVRGGSVAIWGAASGVLRSTLASGFFSSRRAQESEIQALKQELVRLQLNSAEVKVLREEAEALRSLAHLREREEGITAPIISSVTSSPYGTFVIGAGEEDGVALGDLVLTGSEGQGFVIARVSEVAARRSLVTEIFAPGSHLGISVRGAQFELEGRGGGNARVEVPATFAVDEGDAVLAPELGGRAVGVVGAVQDASSAAYKNIYLRSVVPASSLTFVYVISPEK